MLRNWLCLSLLSLAISACVTIPDTRQCAVAGKLSAGGICSHTLTADTNDLSFPEFLDILEAQPDRTCVPVPGMNICAENQSAGAPVKLPSRGAAIVMSSEDWNKMKTALEQACRELGKRCSYEVKQVIAKISQPLVR